MNWTIQTFDDLVFVSDQISKMLVAVIEEFVNGYGVRVEKTVDGYNLTVLKNKVEYNKTHLQKKHLNSLTKNEVTDYMLQIQRFGRQSY